MINTSTVYPGLTKVLTAPFKGILLDAYGVFWGGNACGLFPGSQALMEQLVLATKFVGILSNSTQMAASEGDKLCKHGLVKGRHFHFLITSGELARTLFLSQQLPFPTPSCKFWVLGGIHPKYSAHTAIFKDTSYNETPHLAEADFIYIAIPHINGEDQTDPEHFRKELQQIISYNKPMVCANPDLFAHEGQPVRAVVRQGSIAKLYEELGGKVFYIGKPYQKAYEMALEQFRSAGIQNPHEILMVGDTPETDIRGARRLGIPSALILETGMMKQRILKTDLESSLKALPTEDTPDYFIERFADGIYSTSQS